MNLKQFIQLSGIALFLTVTPAFVFASCSDDNVVEEPVTPPDDDDDDKEEEKPDEALLKTCQTILERIKNANLPTNASNVEKDVAKWMEQLREDGSFPDINYTDRAYSWIPGNHLTRVKQMAQAYVLNESKYYGNEDLYQEGH